MTIKKQLGNHNTITICQQAVFVILHPNVQITHINQTYRRGENMNITVCGGGNGANALAGYLGLHGHSVRLYETPEFAKNVEYLSKNNQTITMVGDICGKLE